MTRRGIIIASFVGLAFAGTEAVFLPLTQRATFGNSTVAIIVELLGALAAGIAGRVILGRRRIHRYFKAGVPLLAAASGFAFTSAAYYWLISQEVSFGPPPSGLSSQVVTALIIGGVAYLLAATIYGFAGTRQGVAIGPRIGLLLLLLLAVLPMLNVAGLIGFVITAFVRKPAPATAPTTPVRPAASE